MLTRTGFKVVLVFGFLIFGWLANTVNAQSDAVLYERFLASEICSVITFTKSPPLWSNKSGPIPASLSWVAGGVWDRSYGLRVVDMPFEHLKDVGLNGRLEPSKVKGLPTDKMQPAMISSSEDGSYVVLVYQDMSLGTPQPGILYFFDSVGRPQASVPIDPNIPGGALASVYGLTKMPEGVLAFGWRRTIENKAEPAFVYISKDGRYQVIQESIFEGREMSDGLFESFRSHFPFMTSLGHTGYVLIMDQPPRVGTIDLESGSLELLPEFPEDFLHLPDLHGNQRWIGRPSMSIHQLFQFYDTLQHSRMVVGIYGWEEHLYLLSKEAMDTDGKTEWSLIEIDPNRGNQIVRNRLPTTAQDILPIPGRLWGLIEKGPIEVIGSYPADHLFRKTDSMVVFPGRFLEEGNMKLKSEPFLTCGDQAP